MAVSISGEGRTELCSVSGGRYTLYASHYSEDTSYVVSLYFKVNSSRNDYYGLAAFDPTSCDTTYDRRAELGGIGSQANTSVAYWNRSVSPRTARSTVTISLSGWSTSGMTEVGEVELSVSVPSLPTYTISYNANGGTGAPSAQSKAYGSSVSVSSSTPVWNGYTFNSWNTEPDGTGTTYAPGASYSANANVTLYAIWNPVITFNANGGTGAPNPVTKTFNSTATIPSTRPTKHGYIFVRWTTYAGGTGMVYQPGDTVPAAMNASMTLYAQYDTITAPPTISSLTVIRCDQYGHASDMGSYASVQAYWSVDLTYDSSNTATVTGSYTSDSGTSGSFALSPSSGTSGPSTAIVPNIDTDKQYTFVVSVTDTNRDVGHTNTTTRNAILTRAKFILDFRAGGNAVGIGSAAPASGLMVGYATTFNDDVTFNDLVKNGSRTTWNITGDIYRDGGGASDMSFVFEDADGFTADRLEFQECGPLHGLYLSTYGSLTANRWTTVGRILSNPVASKYIPREMEAGFVWSGGIGRISTSGDVSVYAFDNYSIVTICARYY